MGYNLYLDDWRYPKDSLLFMELNKHHITTSGVWLNNYKTVYYCEDWVIVRNYEEFVKTIEEKGIPCMISFDHDLGQEIEIWKDIDEYVGIYKVSNWGRIKRIKKCKGTSGNNILTPNKNISGLIVMLKNNGNDCRKAIHIIMCESFYGINPNKKYVNHKDGNRWNNNIDNLEWCTNSENVMHSHRELERDFSAYGENHKNSKSVSQYDKNENLIDVYGSVNEAGRQLKIFFGNIAKCARGERKYAGGFIWKYENRKITKKSKIEHITNKNYTKNFFIPIINEKTGYDCAKWLINYCIDNKKELPATILIHSMNPAGSLNIKSLFDTYNKYFPHHFK